MLCFPHAGGSASFFYRMSAALHPEVEVWAVQYPGRQDRLREPLIDDIGRLADGVFGALREYLPTVPVFFGHSMGSAVAFEVARRMEQLGVSVPRLVVSGRRAPSLWRNDNVHQRGDAELLAEVQELSGTPLELLTDAELRRAYLPVIRNDYRAIETYTAAQDLAVRCPITMFVGDRDPRVTLDEAEAWHRHTSAGFQLHVFPGGHFYLTERPAETVACLRDVLGVATSPLRRKM